MANQTIRRPTPSRSSSSCEVWNGGYQCAQLQVHEEGPYIALVGEQFSRRCSSNYTKTFAIHQSVCHPKSGMEGANARNYQSMKNGGTVSPVAEHFLKEHNTRFIRVWSDVPTIVFFIVPNANTMPNSLLYDACLDQEAQCRRSFPVQ